ncbi:GTPase HflX [Paramagnetospirillum magneticum]|uniref:GTPase HflX n=1 Tax=Paramagnetospirillum magneticum (strain ATCC 700264 / AMB-1) TaxID=342108 RepID=Q2W4P8_PARM1|nr:GTPase HflX [Paramagnetospirillum magneticum]BAE51177.1 GTPase [Paramagnetospirillum magneticum AMB-1]
MGEPGSQKTAPSRAMVVHPAFKGGEGNRLPEARLAEAVGLAGAINLDIVAAEAVNVSKVRPATLIGKGAVERLAELVEERDIALAVVDGHLTPVQQRNLEKAWGCKVIDRTGLILEIFGARARTREGTLQVELAALSYQRSRLVRSWTHLERQRGGFGFLGGPGETQIEADRRMIGERIVKLERELEDVKRTRDLHRKARRRVPYPIVALVGYTNAGKSTLFNQLTRAEVLAKDMLFATLDPTMRDLVLPSGRKIILSDTVGFISDLPHELVAAFRATLEEVLEADVVVHVRDVSHPDTEAQAADVDTVLKELGLAEVVDRGLVEALNKIDLLDDERRQEVLNQARRREGVMALSAVTGQGVDELLAELDRRLGHARETIDVALSLGDGASIAWLYRHGEVVARRDDEAQAFMRVKLDPADVKRFHQRKAEGRGH